LPSQLTGLMRQLSWTDFRVVARPAPPPGQSADAAETDASVTTSNINLHTVAGSRPPVFQLTDNITVSITFNAHLSWRANWVQTMSQADQDRLLRHEQGHYNIAALIGRDFFLELMRLKSRTYANRTAFQSDIHALQSNFLSKMQPAHDRYDTATKHGAVQVQQDSWNNFFNVAFTQQRTPPTTAADGTPLKRPLLDVLRDAGIRL
jgi:uncharacterized protein DUF922